MTADPKVSPRPWSVDMDSGYCIFDAEGVMIVDYVYLEDDCSAIVRCINAHDGLVEALEDAIAGMHYIEQGHGRLYGVGWDRVYDKARAALAAAKEGA